MQEQPELLVQRQLDAYNARDIDAFVACYSEDVEVYNHPATLVYKGREAMRERYAAYFESAPELHCELVNRITIGNKAIDREQITGRPDGKVAHAVAIY
ncbi:MAG: hypothetical protein A2Z34_09380 [Planctomycetes bacterium RBG_16_59_8]|nr:MAG: hypothetical protein A2Z34_09380 [Planctomycetes bacterium RBG_16_59_8]